MAHNIWKNNGVRGHDVNKDRKLQNFTNENISSQ